MEHFWCSKTWTRKLRAAISNCKMFGLQHCIPGPFLASISSSFRRATVPKNFTWKLLTNYWMQHSAARAPSEQWYFLWSLTPSIIIHNVLIRFTAPCCPVLQGIFWKNYTDKTLWRYIYTASALQWKECATVAKRNGGYSCIFAEPWNLWSLRLHPLLCIHGKDVIIYLFFM